LLLSPVPENCQPLFALSVALLSARSQACALSNLLFDIPASIVLNNHTRTVPKLLHEGFKRQNIEHPLNAFFCPYRQCDLTGAKYLDLQEVSAKKERVAPPRNVTKVPIMF
jgi:hypothetical protein